MRHSKPETRHRLPSNDTDKKNGKQLFETQSRSFGPLLGALLNWGTWANAPTLEIAEIIGVSVRAAKSRLFHAREALRNSSKLHKLRTVNRRRTILRFWLPTESAGILLNKTEATHEDDTRCSQTSRNIAVPYRGGDQRLFLVGINAMTMYAASARRAKHLMVWISDRYR